MICRLIIIIIVRLIHYQNNRLLQSWAMPDAASAAKRSFMLPRGPMPFWHNVKVFFSSVYQIKILCDEGFFWGGGGVSLVCHLFHP